ncbi:hippurate hydrolase [Corynebacterium renale]|uniref:amidohydrolase n=1 Tax=Corynebacterium renale TaxID=1724 RepID=UPI000DA34409|nr:amidohydrolase [Corynebacterium renale]SQG64940.1 hippurate hydrolase [Corynebacterium renale]STC96801.1 hippurate hydrolase [Corynebacterium renale]
MRIAHLLATTTADLSFQKPLYEHLHAHPELSGMERATAEVIAQQLERFDCEVLTGIGGFGLVAIFRNGEGPTALMRADFDALPVQETTGVPYASTRIQARPDGSTTPVMHACGHDMHVTALLGACAILDHERDAWQGTFIALFQPAEETGVGADAMIADGLTQRIPTPDVCFGQHVMPGRAGEVQTLRGPQLAAADSITITIPGVSAHGSMPHKAIDPTLVAAMIIIRLQAIVGREVDPNEFAVVTVGSVQAGTTNNIIPDSARLLLNCRFYNDEVKQRVLSAIERVVRAECQASNCPGDPTFEYWSHAELTDNTPAVFDVVRPNFDEVFGKESTTAIRSTVSEDFSHIPRAFGSPYLFWFIGCTPQALWDQAVEAGTTDTDVPVNHMSTFIPEYEPTVKAATHAGVVAALSYLGR